MLAEYKTREQKQRFYNSTKWKQLRKQVLERCNHECQECKRNGYVTIDTNEYSETAKRKKIRLIAHHKKELEFHPDLALEIENIEILCVRCHEQYHDRGFKYKENKWKHDEKW